MSTRTDILQAALGCFADKGYDRATIREISAEAGCNLASINYYFGDKQQLYAQVLAFAYQTLGTAPMPIMADGASPERALRIWIEWYVERILGEGAHRTGQLMVHELARPTAALDMLATSGVQPVFDELRRIISALSPGGLTNDEIARFALSVVGQCLIYRTGESLLARLNGVPQQDTPAIASHIASVSIAAVMHAHEVQA
ncbi:MAG: TetR/AcrR family transcriptional regulator [Phycisphaerales bacterium]|nr:TetR/AcrR family transcriptional regulator [Phycisphaerales bacterium]